MGAQGEADLLGRAELLGNPVQRGVERLGALACDLPEEVRLRLDVGIEGALLHPHRLGEVADRRAVVALLGEEPGGLARQLGTPRGHACARSSEMARKTSAAARWNPSGRPAAAKVAAISSISPTQRQPFVAAEAAACTDRSGSSGSDSSHSSSSVGSTPSLRASERTARRSAAVPFVQAAYAIFTAEAEPISSEIARASTTVSAKSSATESASTPDR